MLGGMAGHKRGMFAEPDQMAKRMAGTNPEYQQAFRVFDRDGSGLIDIGELNQALQQVKQSVEGSSPRAMFPQAFNPATVLFMAARFAQSGNIAFPQFAEMMQYLESLRAIFHEIDVDRSGDLSVSELSRALNLSGFNVSGNFGGGDMMSLQVAEKIGRAYDADGNGVLSFDEFVQLRLEWDNYLNAWEANVPPGSNNIAPANVLAVLESIKKSLEPVYGLAQGGLPGGFGFSMSSLNGLFYTSMFQGAQRPFSTRTCEMLIMRFGNGNLYLTFEQFCIMMEFLKDQKKVFTKVDQDRSGSLQLGELAVAFAESGMPLPAQSVQMIGQRYDADNSGSIEFDEFLQMMTEWTQAAAYQNQFTGYGQQRAGVQDLQQMLGGIRIFYRTFDGVIPSIRPFAANTCRLLIAMFGSPLPGEAYPKGVTYNEYLQLIQHVKLASMEFSQCDFDKDGTISAGELQVALSRSGLNMPPQSLLNMLASYDFDHDGRVEFDEFLQILLEAQHFNRRVQSIAIPGLDPYALFNAVYPIPRTFCRTY